MPYPFDWDAKHWESVDQFTQYLAGVPDPGWTNLIVHHTWKPTQPDWKGMDSMQVLERYYRDQVIWYDVQGNQHKGWWSAPNLFVCKGSPKAEWDGIFQGTPINHTGTHAGACNPRGPGIEVVGNFDYAPWDNELFVYMVELLVALCRWTGLPAQAIIGHRDCGSPKSCPGHSVDLSVVRSVVGAALTLENVWDKWGNEYPLPTSQRVFGIPRAWESNMKDPKQPIKLGAAKSWPTYDNSLGDFVVQLFEHGLIRYHNGSAKTVLYKDVG